ncbi:hypothetical protein MNB_SM-4-1697 [hydrothermal vent metagenome]|uniref:Outer membrane protein beta-barrel domain-containing protein n=1 Tax=hydrothermal vent metagenome TaxID=652676 RepID=A0A1W1BLR2_9ZZZZ
MKLKMKIFILILLSGQNIYANENYTFGIGFGGSTYGGLGTNIGLVSDTDMKYISAGLKGYQSYGGARYSLGIGWITTALISNSSNNHGIGLYLGLVDQEYTYDLKKKNVYGYGLTYNYFFNGISESGTNLGLSLTNYSYSYENKIGLSLELGYQF